LQGRSRLESCLTKQAFASCESANWSASGRWKISSAPASGCLLFTSRKSKSKTAMMERSLSTARIVESIDMLEQDQAANH
ncbi:hypothetical protein KCV07_g329, partial [Aureobasidium melanogenum]